MAWIKPRTLEIIRAIRVNGGENSISSMSNLIHAELSEAIIGDALKVLHALKPGLDDKRYENALVIELSNRGHHVDQQRSFPVTYDGRLIGPLIPDLFVDDLVIVDPQVATAFPETHVAQMAGYLALTNLKLALFLNFKSARLAWQRIVRSQQDPLEMTT